MHRRELSSVFKAALISCMDEPVCNEHNIQSALMWDFVKWSNRSSPILFSIKSTNIEPTEHHCYFQLKAEHVQITLKRLETHLKYCEDLDSPYLQAKAARLHSDLSIFQLYPLMDYHQCNMCFWSGKCMSCFWSGKCMSCFWSGKCRSCFWSGKCMSFYWSDKCMSFFWSVKCRSCLWSGKYMSCLYCQMCTNGSPAGNGHVILINTTTTTSNATSIIRLSWNTSLHFRIDINVHLENDKCMYTLILSLPVARSTSPRTA